MVDGLNPAGLGWEVMHRLPLLRPNLAISQAPESSAKPTQLLESPVMIQVFAERCGISAAGQLQISDSGSGGFNVGLTVIPWILSKEVVPQSMAQHRTDAELLRLSSANPRKACNSSSPLSCRRFQRHELCSCSNRHGHGGGAQLHPSEKGKSLDLHLQ